MQSISHIYKTIKERLNKFSTLIESLKIHNAYVSGSFILQCIFGEIWTSDIDIYCKSSEFIYDKHDTLKNIMRFLNVNDENSIRILSPKIKQYPYLKSYQNNMKLISDVLYFEYKGQIFNLIISKCDPRIIIENFDYSFLSNYFDGYGLVMLDPKAVETKTSVENIKSTNEISRESRYQKYTDRGFTIIRNNIHTCETIKCNGKICRKGITPIIDASGEEFNLCDVHRISDFEKI